MFLLLGQATAGPDSEYRSGGRHGVLVYVLAESVDAACAIAEAKMPSVGWQDIRFDRGGKLANEPAEDDPAALGAHRTAMAGGCGIVVYSDPVTPEQNNLLRDRISRPR